MLFWSLVELFLYAIVLFGYVVYYFLFVVVLLFVGCRGGLVCLGWVSLFDWVGFVRLSYPLAELS